MGASRRTSGALLILVVLFGALVAATLTTRTIPGQAAVAPVPGPPAVGSCVLDPLIGGGGGAGLVEVGGGIATVGPYAQQKFGTCRTAHYGELVKVFPHRTHTVTLATDPTQPPFEGPVESTQCSTAAQAFLGGLELSGSTPRFGDWQPVIPASSTLVDPTPRQRAAGQDWAGCVVGQIVATDSNASSAPAYTGTLRDALAGKQRDQYGWCYANETFSRTVFCGRAHLFEVFGLQTVARPLLLSTARDTCRSLLVADTKRPGLLDEGPLSMVITSLDSFGQAVVPLPATVQVGTTISCAISARAAQPLVGSLLDIGRTPLPLGR